MAEVLRPSTLRQLEEVVAWAVASETALEVIGRGSKQGYGRAVEATHVLALDGLAGIAMHEPAELVMSAGAGTPLAEIEAVLDASNQELAFEPADYGALCGGEPGRQTIGGVFACNLSGPRRLRSGAARDHLLGAQMVTGHGHVVVTGGRVVKNVTGYDLCKLLTGSFGTLAALSQVTFKVMPKAETATTLLVLGRDEAELLALLRRATGTAADVAGAAMLPPLASGRSVIPAVRKLQRSAAALRLEGTAPSVAFRAQELEVALAGPGLEQVRVDADETRILWREIRDVTLLTRAAALWRLTVPPTRAGELVGWTAEVTYERLFDRAGGLIWLAPREAFAAADATIRRAVEDCGGSATLVRGSAELRRKIAPFQPQDPALAALTRRVKASFDPKAVLNPGRMYAGI